MATLKISSKRARGADYGFQKQPATVLSVEVSSCFFWETGQNFVSN